LVAARAAVIKQDIALQEVADKQRLERYYFFARIGFSLVAIGIGTALVMYGFQVPGFFLIGAATAVYVPDFVKAWLASKKGGGPHGTV
jgi:hypothetical protein